MKKRKFTCLDWDFDGEGDAYIIAKSECPDRELVAEYVMDVDCLDPLCKPELERDITDGWCKYQCRSDWSDGEGAHGSYVVEESRWHDMSRNKHGWFPVWIVRKEAWY